MINRIFRRLYSFLHGYEIHPYDVLPLLLISGVGRSGTSALRFSLGVHRDVQYTGTENNIIHDVMTVALRNCTMASRKTAM